MCQIGSQQPVSKDQLYDSFLLYLYHFKLNLKVVKSKIGVSATIQLAKKFLINYHLDRETQILIPK